jgi:hypothetical protein
VTDLVELARFPTRIAADFARLQLESEGIEAILFDAETNAIGWGPMMPVRLMVLDRDRSLAAKLLEELD